MAGNIRRKVLLKTFPTLPGVLVAGRGRVNREARQGSVPDRNLDFRDRRPDPVAEGKDSAASSASLGVKGNAVKVIPGQFRADRITRVQDGQMLQPAFVRLLEEDHVGILPRHQLKQFLITGVRDKNVGL